MSVWTVLFHLACVPVSLVLANLAEWSIHRRLLHGLGRNKRSFWAFHWHEHHKEARRHDMIDPNYAVRSVFGWNPQGKEAAALVAGVAATLPLLPYAPLMTVGFAASALYYHYVHKRAHSDPAWARVHLPWHVDHHLGPDQDCNWCVTYPLGDYLFGTRRPYIGTEAEARDLARRAGRSAP